MYIGLVKYKLKNHKPDLNFKIGHNQTENLLKLKKWKKHTEQLEHVIECKIYKDLE